MKTHLLAPAALLCAFIAATPAHSQNTAHTPGDLVLFFQNPDGSKGGNVQVFASLGDTATVFRQAFVSGQNLTNIVNINAVMTNTYDVDWASEETLWGGLGGSWSTSTGSALQNLDPSRTIYTSMPRAEAGTPGQPSSTQPTFNTDTGITTCANSVAALANVFETGASTQVAAITNGLGTTVGSVHPIDNFGAGPSWNSTIPAPGVQQQGSPDTVATFGPFTSVEFLWDLYRIQARNNVSGQFGIGDPVRQGVFLGTVVLTTSGDVHFVAAASPASAYDTWAASFGLDPLQTIGPVAGNRASDPDGDGSPNFREFAFGTDPTRGNAADLRATRSGASTVLTTIHRNTDVASYTLQSRSSLPVGTWTNSGLVPSVAPDQSGVPSGYTRMVYTNAPVPGPAFFRMLAAE